MWKDITELEWEYLGNCWELLWQKCDKYVATLYVIDVSRSKCWWLAGARTPGPPDQKSDYNGKSQQYTID